MTTDTTDTTDIRLECSKWGQVCNHLIDARATLLWFADEENYRSFTPDMKDLFKRAARSLSPFVSDAVAEEHELKRQIAEREPVHELAPRLWSDEEFAALGKEVANDETLANMCRQGRPLTNVEMSAYLLATNEDAAQASACGKFARSYLQWLDELERENSYDRDGVDGSEQETQCAGVDAES